MKPGDQAKAEQELAFSADNLSHSWVRMYKNLVEGGFTNEQAFELVRSFVLSMFPPRLP